MKMISREDLKQRVMGHFCGSCSVPYKDADILELGEYCCDMVSDTIAFIDGLPTIEAPPVKHGRWIIDYVEGTKIYNAHCSECGKEPTRHIGGNYYIDKLTDFCPNCGARMGGDS